MCLTSVVCKVMETILQEKLASLLEGNIPFRKFQHSFRKKRSCPTNLRDYNDAYYTRRDKIDRCHRSWFLVSILIKFPTSILEKYDNTVYNIKYISDWRDVLWSVLCFALFFSLPILMILIKALPARDLNFLITRK